MEYATPTEAEEAFYQAFTRQDLALMMSVWLVADHVECIHPGGPRLQGIEAVRHGWQQIFKQSSPLHFQIVRQQCTQAANLAIHSVTEQIHSPRSSPATTAEVIATNVYELTADGWRMILHHASPAKLLKTSETIMH